MSENTEEKTIEIEEVTKAEPTAFATEGLLPEEVDMAKEHGLVEEEKVDESSKEEEKDGEHEESTEPKTEDSEEDESEEKVDTFEDVEKDEGKLKKYNKNEQALYWKYKSDKRKRQSAQKERDEFKSKYDLETVKYNAKLKKISEELGKEGVTIETLQAIVGGETEEEAPLTRAEYQRLESEKSESSIKAQQDSQFTAERLTTAENIGKTKYDNFEELTTLAQKVIDEDKTNTYRKLLDESFKDKDIDEEQLVEKVVLIAKLSPDFGKKKTSDNAEKTDVDRVIKNSKKKASSASVASGGGKRTVAESDLTSDDTINMSQTKWDSLKESTRQRLLQG